MSATWNHGDRVTPFVARYVAEILVGTGAAAFSIAASTVVWLLIAANDPALLTYSLLSILAMGVYLSEDMFDHIQSDESASDREDYNWVLEATERVVVVVLFNVVIAFGAAFGIAAGTVFGATAGVVAAMGYAFWECASIDRDGKPIPLSLFAFTVYLLLGLRHVSSRAEAAIEYLDVDDFSVQRLPVLATFRTRRQ